MLARTLAAPLLIVLVTAHPAAARPSLDAAHLSQLGRYDVLVFSDPTGRGIERGKAIGVIDATPEEVFRVATDYGKYQDFMPRIESSRVVRSDAAEAVVEIAAKLPWPAWTARVYAKYLHDRLPGDIFRVRFSMLEGTMKQYLGSLYIEPWSTGQTAVTYELVAEPRTIAPGSAINKGVRRTVGSFVHALRQRINELHKAGFLHPTAQARIEGPLAPLPLVIQRDALRAARSGGGSSAAEP